MDTRLIFSYKHLIHCVQQFYTHVSVCMHCQDTVRKNFLTCPEGLVYNDEVIAAEKVYVQDCSKLSAVKVLDHKGVR